MKRTKRIRRPERLSAGLLGLSVSAVLAWGQAEAGLAQSEKTDKPDTLVATPTQPVYGAVDASKNVPHDSFTIHSEGPRSDDEIKEVIRRYHPTVNNIYQRELKASPRLKGNVKIRLTIKQNGIVTAATITENTVGSSRLAWSIQQCILKWQFKPLGAALHTVDLSLPFEPAL